MAKKIKDNDYLYITAYLRAKENGLLNRDRVERMLNAKTANDAAKVLEECGYGDLSDVTVSRLNESIDKKRADVMKDLSSSVPDAGVLDVFRVKYDYHNAKTLIKSEAMETNPEPLLSDAGRYGTDELTAAYFRDDLSGFSDTFKSSVAEAKETLARTGDPQIADFILDKAYFNEFISLAEGTGSKFLAGYGRLMIDSFNLCAAARCARMKKDAKFLERVIADGGNIGKEELLERLAAQEPISAVFSKTDFKAASELADSVAEGGSFTEFEKQCDAVLKRYLQGASNVTFGPEVLISYLCSVENELSDARVIITGKLSGLSSDDIRARIGSYEK